MTEEIIIAGFGGQGVLSLGKIIAYSGIMEGKEVSWMPSYGPEMRGGTCNVTVIISDSQISSPVVRRVDTAVILNQQALDKFEKEVKPGGTLIYDPNGITRHPERKDVNIFKIDAARLAVQLGNPKIYNMVVMGAILRARPILSDENVELGLKKSLPERHHRLIPLNMQAVDSGAKNVEVIHSL